MDISLNGFTYKDVVLNKGKYGDCSLALTLNDECSRIAVVSVWVAGVPAADGCIWVKNYRENAGLMEALEDAGVLERTGLATQVGHVWVPEARVLA